MLNNSSNYMLDLLRQMWLVRFAEESLVGPIKDGGIRCPCHLCSGQEAVAVGVCSALEQKDSVFGNHRSHGHYLAKGGGLFEMFAEIYGAESGCAKGRGGSMHVIDSSCGMLGAAPIVGGTISLALGAALASSIMGDGRVAVSFFGDGATGEGALYESLNFASLKKLPIVFVCENNLYSTHMSIHECRVKEEIFEIAAPFGICSRRVDGNDVIAVHEAAREAVTKCRKGEGPYFIECLTYRLRGHVGPDDNIQGTRTDIRPEEEIASWKAKDPIQRLRSRLIAEGQCTINELDSIEREVEAEVNEAHERARKSAKPDKRELLDHVFK